MFGPSGFRSGTSGRSGWVARHEPRTGPLADRPRWAQPRQGGACGCSPGPAVRLVHELRQLGSCRRILDGGDDRPMLISVLRRDRLDVLRRHPLADHALHPGQAQPGPGSESARRPCAVRRLPKWSMSSVSQRDGGRVDLHLLLAGVPADEVSMVETRSSSVACPSAAPRRGRAYSVEAFVARPLGQVISAWECEVQVLRSSACADSRVGALARPQLAVDVEQGVVLAAWCDPSPGWRASTRSRRSARGCGHRPSRAP